MVIRGESAESTRTGERGTLPVFRLDETPAVRWDILAKLLALSGADETVELVGEWLIFRKGRRRFEINLRTNEFWFSDEAKLWKPDFTQNPPAENTAVSAAATNSVLDAWGGKTFSASSDVKIRLVVGAPRPTRAARVALVNGSHRDPTKWVYSARQKRIIDRHLPIGSELEVPEPNANATEPYRWAPLAGARLRWGITFDATSDDIIGFHGALSSATAPPTWYPAVDEQESIDQFRQRFLGDFSLIDYPPPTLAFEIWESAGERGTWLIPMWQHRAVIRLDDGSPLALPVVSLPASDFDPPPRFVALDFEASSVAGADAVFHTGAWWIDSDNPQNQLSSKENANDFVRGMAAAKWGITKIAGNNDVLVDDWRKYWANGVGKTDFAYYAGHAHDFGWHFNKNLSTTYRLSSSDVGADDTQAQLYGEKLKWIGLCACGPLRDDDGSGFPDDDAFRRWAPAFDGLHALLGYSTDIGARHEQGRRLATYLQTHTVIDAWLRTARVQEVGAAHAAVLYAFMSGSPGSDPLMDRVGPTPSIAQMPSGRPDTFTAMWVPA